MRCVLLNVALCFDPKGCFCGEKNVVSVRFCCCLKWIKFLLVCPQLGKKICFCRNVESCFCIVHICKPMHGECHWHLSWLYYLSAPWLCHVLSCAHVGISVCMQPRQCGFSVGCFKDATVTGLQIERQNPPSNTEVCLTVYVRMY